MNDDFLNHEIVSIVDLFKKNSKPRTKLFIQMIPPGISEDDFMELIVSGYKENINYIAFRPGKIIRDPYGHLIGLDSPNYGYATINFTNPKFCPKFFREFHQFKLSDSHGIKSKLIIEFALIQDIPPKIKIDSGENQKMEIKTGYFRETNLFKEFLKTFPFAAKIEEDRQLAISDSAGNLKNLNLDDEEFDINEIHRLAPVSSAKINELDIKIDMNMNLSVNPKIVSFSSLTAVKDNAKDKVVTPLTDYIKCMSVNNFIPNPEVMTFSVEKGNEKKSKHKSQNKIENGKEEKKQAINKGNFREKEKEKEKEPRNVKNENGKEKEKDKIIKMQTKSKTNPEKEKSHQNHNNITETRKESFINTTKKEQKQVKKKEKEKLVENQKGIAQIKGIPKILGRNPSSTAVTSESSTGEILKKTVNTTTAQFRSTLDARIETSSENFITKIPVKTVTKSIEREIYTRPDVENNLNLDTKELKTETKESRFTRPESSEIKIKKQEIKLSGVKKQKSESELKKPEIIMSDSKIQETETSTAEPVKKVFISASKLRALEKNVP